LILTPYDSTDVKRYLEDSKDYSLIFRTDSPKLFIPSVKTFLKNLTYELGIPVTSYKIAVRPYDQVNFFVYVKN
jgi:hypothetical protein